MSSNLIWEPVDRKTHDLPSELKFALRNRYDGHVDAIMGDNDISYLSGLKDAGVKGADKLIEAIEKYGEIAVKEVY